MGCIAPYRPIDRMTSPLCGTEVLNPERQAGFDAQMGWRRRTYARKGRDEGDAEHGEQRREQPAELLPVSSSAHIQLVPWFAGWPWGELDPSERKSFEVALHAGAAAALVIGQRRLMARELRSFDSRRAAVIALSPTEIARAVKPPPGEEFLQWNVFRSVYHSPPLSASCTKTG